MSPELQSLLQELFTTVPTIEHANLVGSRVTCDPPPTDTDLDVLVFISGLYNDTTQSLFEHGWTCSIGDLYSPGKTGEPMQDFVAWRRGEVNLLVTRCKKYHEKFLLATNVSKSLNLMDKRHRITLFEAIVCNRLTQP